MMYDVTRPCLINISTADSGLSCNSQIQIKCFNTEGERGEEENILLELQSFNLTFSAPSMEYGEVGRVYIIIGSTVDY